ncbi:MAG: aminopeptidase [Oscillospiraceae bacterium]|nr:aminopeptidase [Oscillospiraceae bacterium]
MSKNNKNEVVTELKEKLLYERKNVCITMTDDELQKADSFCDGYKVFLNKGKTEREACSQAAAIAKAAGFTEYKAGVEYKAGDKIYSVNRGKAVILAVIGSRPIEDGVNIIASHIDSPRIDLKQNPLFEDTDLVYFKTHYYGGVKKYQWTALPLALHGVVVKGDGTTVDVIVGEDESEPVFSVTDLLPHLSELQYKRPAHELIKGEELNILIGSRPFRLNGDGNDKNESASSKLAVMKILNDKYGITERDFASAELEAVPAHKARDVGFDRSLVGGYGQDDRVCAYTSLIAITETDAPEKTAICVLADKEEIGSYGNTGLGSDYLRYFIADLVSAASRNECESGMRIRQCLSNSRCLSADVCAALDPTFADVSEKNNAAFMNYGAVIAKYFGSKGKSGTNDASAEFVGEIRKLFDDNNIVWQTGELGKVDAGGGGTVAMFIAKMNVDTVDIGVPVLSMHAPLELSAKADVYSAYRGFKAFYNFTP